MMSVLLFRYRDKLLVDSIDSFQNHVREGQVGGFVLYLPFATTTGIQRG